MPRRPKPIPDPAPVCQRTLRERDAVDLLMRAALIVSSFRNKNAKAGYAFCEPPGTDALIVDIDTHLSNESAACGD